MERIVARENQHDTIAEDMRININKMLRDLPGTLLDKTWFVSSLAHKLSRTPEEYNLMYRRF